MATPTDIQKLPGLAGWFDLEPFGAIHPGDKAIILREIAPATQEDLRVTNRVLVSYNGKYVYLDINPNNSNKTDFVYNRLTGLGHIASNYDATDNSLRNHILVSQSVEKSILQNYNNWADDINTFQIDELYLHSILSGLTTYSNPENATIAPPFYYWVHLYSEEFTTSIKLEIQSFLIKTINTSVDPIEKRRALIALAFDKNISDENKVLFLENYKKDQELKADLLGIGDIAYSEGWCTPFVYSLLKENIQQAIEPITIKGGGPVGLNPKVKIKAKKIELEINETAKKINALDTNDTNFKTAIDNFIKACKKYVQLAEENPGLPDIILPNFNDDNKIGVALKNLTDSFNLTYNRFEEKLKYRIIFPEALGINTDTKEQVIHNNFPIKINPKNIDYFISGILGTTDPVVHRNIVMASLGDEEMTTILGENYKIPEQNWESLRANFEHLINNTFLVSDQHFWELLLQKFPNHKMEILPMYLIAYSQSTATLPSPPPPWWPELEGESTASYEKEKTIKDNMPEELKKSVQEILGVLFGKYVGIRFDNVTEVIPAWVKIYNLNPDLAILLAEMRACVTTSSWFTLDSLKKQLNDFYLFDLGLHLTIQIVPLGYDREQDFVTIKQREIPLIVLSKIDKLETRSIEGNQVTVYSLTALDYPKDQANVIDAYEHYQTAVLLGQHLVVETSYVDAEYIPWVNTNPELASTTTAGPKVSLVDVSNKTENRWEALELSKVQDQRLEPYIPLLKLSYPGFDLNNPENKKKIYDDVLEESIVHETNHVKKGFIMGEPAGEYLSTVASLARSNQPHMVLFEMMNTMLTYDPATKNFGLRKEILPGGKEIIYATEDSHGLAEMLILNQLASSTGVLKDDELIEELAVTNPARFNEVIKQTIANVTKTYNTPEKLRNQALEYENERIQLLREV